MYALAEEGKAEQSAIPSSRGGARGNSPLQSENHSTGAVETILLFGQHCEVISKIGDGAKSMVFLCRNTSGVSHLPRQFAVKRMYFPVEHEVSALAELEMLRSLHSAFIVSLCDGEVARTDGRLCVSLVLEYCPDSLLHLLTAQRSRGQYLGDATLFRLVCCVAGALAYLHAQSPPVTHRDIKAENVLIGVDGMFKICDFGSATTTAYECQSSLEVLKATDDIERSTTLAYRAPEMVDPWQRQRIDEKCDVWALGVLLYYAMYMKMPFEETTLGILNGKIVFEDSVCIYSEALKEIVRRCLVRDPRQRWCVFQLIQYLRSDTTVVVVAPECSKFPFEYVQKPADWISQSAVGSTVSPTSHSITDAPVASFGTSSAPLIAANSSSAENATPSTTLFSLLDWQNTGVGQPVHVVAAPPPPTQSPQPSAVVMEDLFGSLGAPRVSGSAPVQESHVLDAFFLPSR